MPISDLQAQHRALDGAVEQAVARVLGSGRFIGGPEVEAFEREFAALCGAPHAVGVSSGTDALRFALLAAGVTEGEVVTSPFSFIGTTEAIHQAGARPVFADIDPLTFNLDPAAAERAITPRTRALLPVHLYGQTADMAALGALARPRRLALVEDACQAHGALDGGRPAGSLGDAAGFSFYPTKNLGACGDAGAVTTARADLAERVRRLRDHGQQAKYRHAEEGYNGRLDALQAAVLRVKLPHLALWNDRRREIAAAYRERLAALDAKGALTLPHERPGARHVYHVFAVRVRARDRVQARLAERGVESAVHYPVPLHLQPCYASMGLREGAFPEAERAAREVLSLPLHPELTEAQIDQVCEAVASAVAG